MDSWYIEIFIFILLKYGILVNTGIGHTVSPLSHLDIFIHYELIERINKPNSLSLPKKVTLHYQHTQKVAPDAYSIVYGHALSWQEARSQAGSRNEEQKNSGVNSREVRFTCRS